MLNQHLKLLVSLGFFQANALQSPLSKTMKLLYLKLVLSLSQVISSAIWSMSLWKKYKVPLGFRMRSHSAKTWPIKGMYVEPLKLSQSLLFPMLYGGSVKTRSTEPDGTLAISVRQSPSSSLYWCMFD